MVRNRDQWRTKPSTFSIQGDSGGTVNILGGDSSGHCETKVHMNMFIIPDGPTDSCVNLQNTSAVLNVIKEGKLMLLILF